MIDLEQAELPHEIMTGDGWVPVLTGFRAWVRFGRALREAHSWWPGIFDGPEPRDWHDGALEFYRSPVATPREGRSSKARTLDLALDGDYVVGSFQAAYGIDLTDPALDMHWHRFLALLRSLPQDSMVARIAGWRSWTREDAKRKPEAIQRDLRAAWALPSDRESSSEVVSEQQAIFGGVVAAYAMEVQQHV